MKNFIQLGDVITHVVSGSAIASGDVVVKGELVGIAAKSGAVGETIPVNLVGVFEVTKVGSQAWTQGDKIFWDKTNSKFTKVASADADLHAGYAFEDAGAGAGVVLGYLKLCPLAGKKAAAVADEATVDGSSTGTTQTLANALKVKVNEVLAALRAAGIMDT